MKKQKWILLNVGDIVQDGDEEYSADPNDILYEEGDVLKWHHVSVTFMGEAVQENDPPIRRKM